MYIYTVDIYLYSYVLVSIHIDMTLSYFPALKCNLSAP